MSEEFNPRDHDRPPRSQGYEEETQAIINHLKSRGDQRIGQLLINAVSQEIKWEEPPEDIESLSELRNNRYKNKAKVEQKLYSIEAPELLEAIEKMEEQHS